MCGIIGFIGKLHEDKTETVFTNAFKELQTRGKDASGLAAVFEDGSFTAIKHCVPSSELITFKEYKDIMKQNPIAVIAHTRAQTHGSNLKNINNHPFWSENGEWFIVHNGIITADYPEIKKELKSECDSEKILRLIEHYGVEEAFSHLDKSGNSYAVLALNTKEKRIYNIKNGQRDCITKRTIIDNRPSVFFCSTPKIADEGYKSLNIHAIPLTFYMDTAPFYMTIYNYEGFEIARQYITPKPVTYSNNKNYNWYEDDETYMPGWAGYRSYNRKKKVV
jgi:predicted glutamine amidotransferase